MGIGIKIRVGQVGNPELVSAEVDEGSPFQLLQVLTSQIFVVLQRSLQGGEGRDMNVKGTRESSGRCSDKAVAMWIASGSLI
jgi:hypothetical protein